MELEKIIGKKVITIRGFNSDKRRKRCFEPQYILFDDGETFIELSDQDYYAYHDCATSAKHISVITDANRWADIYKDKQFYPIADIDI